MKRRVLASVVALLLVTAGTAAAVTTTTIYNVQQKMHAIGDTLAVEDIVVTGVDVAATTYGFWAQEQAGGQYGGILVYSGSILTELHPGLVVDVTLCRYEEYPSGVHDSLSLSELTYSPIAWTIVDSIPVPAPVSLTCTDLGMRPYNYANAEPWEGTLVKLTDVVCVAHDPSYVSSFFLRQAYPTGPEDTVTVYVRNNKLVSPGPGRPAIGDTLASITGLAHYESSRYQLCPRNADDIVYAGAEPAPNLALAYATSNTGIQAVFDCRVDETTAENPNNYYLATETTVISAELDLVEEQVVTLTTAAQTGGAVEELTVAGVKSKGGTIMPEPGSYAFRAGLTPISMVQEMKAADNDSSKLTLEQVTIAGIVTGDKTPYITHMYVEERPGGPWHGVQIYGGAPVVPTEGDSVILSGYVSEYYNKTELTGIDYLAVCSSGNPLPGPTHVDPGLIKTGATTAESYEGVYVRCDPVFVADTVGFDAYGEWKVADTYGTLDSVLVGHNGDYTYIPKPGQWMNIRGPIDYIYEDFRIEPRYDADIDTVNVIAVDPGVTPAPAVFSLEQNFPNPFNPVTTVMFSLPEKGEAMLAVYDVSGRLVKTLYHGVLDQGKHKATWDGRNNAGRVVSSGVYFCKLVAKDKTAETKMVVLK
ncbi:MAG: T9SS type A sorting domain-containing protein [Candidatus Eisenbacteria bacterium]|nr:T9SS type A sorting domain-containing protein [Candidatus Eisenbacteria bacterium]